MNRVWNISLVAMILFASTLWAQTATNPVLQQGVHVEMAPTTGAASLPDADNPDAWIVTVTDHGDLYFGVQSVTLDGLLETMRDRPRNRGQELYIKADGRARVTDVSQVLEIAGKSLFKRAFLLTAQPSGAQPGTIISPKGLSIWVGLDSSESVVVHISAGQESPTLKINNRQVPLKALQHKLEQLLQNQNDRVVLLKAEQVPFADVVRVVDVCNMAGAMAILAPPRL